MESLDNFRERIEALEQQMKVMGAHTRIVERRLRWRRIPWSVAAVAALGLALALALPAQAKTLRCGAGDVACLIAAINEANANGQTNTIRLEAGTYTLTTVDNTTDGPNGLPSMTSALTLRGAGADLTILEPAFNVPSPGFRLVHVAASGHLTLAGVTLRGGESPVGGGLFNQGGTVTITQSTVTGNRANGPAGGVATHGGTVHITNSRVIGNGGTHGVGGLLADGGTVTITQSTIAGNGGEVAGGKRSAPRLWSRSWIPPWWITALFSVLEASLTTWVGSC